MAEGVASEAGSKALKGYKAISDSTVVERLKTGGVDISGTSQVSEFGIDDDSLIIVGDSILFELRPTEGLIPKAGLITATSTLSQVKISAERIEDIQEIFKIIVPDYLSTESADLKVAVTEGVEIDGEIIELPNLDYIESTYEIISSAEISSNLARYDGLRYGSTGFGTGIKSKMIFGAYLLLTSHDKNYYKKALEAREVIKKDFTNLFNNVDLIIVPNRPLYDKLISLTGFPSILVKEANLKIIGNRFQEGSIFEFVRRWNTNC